MTTRPLLLTRDPDLVDDLRRLAAVAGIEPDVATSAAEARRTWSSASVVVVGDDLVDEAAHAGLRRRADVVVAGGTEACIHPITVAAFAAMRALSTRNDQPWRWVPSTSSSCPLPRRSWSSGSPRVTARPCVAPP